MPPAFTALKTSIKIKGRVIPGATDRQRLIPGFDQNAYSRAKVCCVGAGGIISHIAPALARKGIGQITLLDRDVVEASNLNRQRFYQKDIGKNKAVALAKNLKEECIAGTAIRGYGYTFQQAVARRVNLNCDVAVCGVDNNPARIAASRFFRSQGIPVIFAAVSRDADHGYVFVQEKQGACIACLFPDIAGDDQQPCPGTPAILDILQAVGALAVFAVDTVLMARPRSWNCRRISLSGASPDVKTSVQRRVSCTVLNHECEP